MNKKGYYYLCVIENKQITELSKLTPSRMLDLFKYLVIKFGDEDYDSVVDILDYWPVDFSLKNKKPVQSLYINHYNHKVIDTGYIVYASNREMAKQLMQDYLE